LVISPVHAILKHLKTLPQVSQEFHLIFDISFFNHLNPIRNAAAEDDGYEPSASVIPESSKKSSRPKTPSATSSNSRGQPDIVCIYSGSSSTTTGDEPSNKLILPIELKPPHKLTKENLRQGLHPMDLLSDVININKIPLDTTARDQQESTRRVAATTTQLFSYMVEGGVEYGILANGEAFIFLHIDIENPRVLYYHCLNPTADLSKSVHSHDVLHRTAVGQVLAFILLALESSRQSELTDKQNAINDAFKDLNIWPSAPTQDTSPSAVPPRTPSPTSPPYSEPRHLKGKESDLSVRQPLYRKAKAKVSCNSNDGSRGYFNPEDPEDPTPPAHKSDTKTMKQKGSTSTGSLKGSSSGISGNYKSSSKRPARERHEAERYYPYCSSACILSLVNRSSLPDPECPNYRLHSNYSPLNSHTFLHLIRAQLLNTRDQYIYPLGIQGAVGVLFKIALKDSGYVLLAKGTVDALKHHLVYESHVYRYLEPVQSIHVPVCLGYIPLYIPYYYDIGVQIKHLLLLSYGGSPLPKYITQTISPGDQWWNSEEVKRAVKTIEACGIDHQDIRVPNLLWDEAQKRVIVIDFERSTVLEENDHRKRKRGLLES
jgi:hypothetical protein